MSLSAQHNFQQNHIKTILGCAWRKKFIVLGIFAVSVGIASYLYIRHATYISKGTLLVQRAQNSSIHEMSAGLGGLTAERFGSIGKDLYLEKFLMYLKI
jgi:hypothetical protein